MMSWLKDHWLEAFTAWVALNTILSPVSAKVPSTTWYGKALHVFVAVSPMDVMKAIKTVGAAAVPPVALLLLVAGLSLGGTACVSQTQPTSTPTTKVDPRAIADATTALLETAWKAAASTCLELANSRHDDAVRQKCESILTPARNSLIAAQSAIDVWGAAEQKNFPCLVASVLNGFSSVSQLLPALTLPQAVKDAMIIAQQYSAQCVSGGAS